MMYLIKLFRKTTLSRFIFAGCINVAFSYSVFSSLIYFKFHYSFALLCSTVLGVIFSFLNFGNFVFYNPDKKLISRFIMVYVVLYFCNLLLLSWLLPIFKNAYLTQALIIMPLACCSYRLNKDFVFPLSKQSLPLV